MRSKLIKKLASSPKPTKSKSNPQANFSDIIYSISTPYTNTACTGHHTLSNTINHIDDRDSIVVNTKGYIHTIDKMSGQEIVKNKNKNYNKLNRNKLAQKLISMSQNTSECIEMGLDTARKEDEPGNIEMSDAITEHESPYIDRQLRNDIDHEQDEDDGYISRLLRQAKAVDFDHRSMADVTDRDDVQQRDRLKREPDDIRREESREMGVGLDDEGLGNTVEKMLSNGLSAMETGKSDKKLTVSIRKMKPQSEKRIPIRSVSKNNIKKQLKPNVLGKQVSDIIGKPLQKRKISIVIPVKKPIEEPNAYLNRKNTTSKDPSTDPTLVQNDQKIKISLKTNEIDLSFDSSTSSVYDKIELIEPSEQYSSVQNDQENIKSPPAISNIAWDLKDPSSPLRIAIRRKQKTALAMTSMLARGCLDPIVKGSKLEERTPMQAGRHLNR